MKTFMYHGQELLSISYDVVFKVIFGKNENKEMWALLLSTENEEVIDMLTNENKNKKKAVEKLQV